MSRFALPGGRWRYLLPGALVVTGLAAKLLSALAVMFEDFGSTPPLHARIAASPSWVVGWLALAMLGVVAAGLLRRREASTGVLVAVTSLLLVAAAFTILSVIALWSSPLDCMHARPIR